LVVVTPAGLKEPVQKRSQASLNRLLKAGAKLLAEHGYAGFTIPELSRRAKVSAGLIYGRFENKDALFHAIQDRELDRIGRQFDEITDPARWAGRPLGSLLEELIPEAADFIDSHAPLFNEFLARGAVDDTVLARGAVFISGLNERLRALMLTRRDEISRPDPERAAAMACELVVAAFVRRSRGGAMPPEPSFGLTWDEIVVELPTVCCAYLSS
jgi:AcrR family transcriptional regulator